MASLGIPVPPQRPAPRPITVDVPMAVLADVPPPTPPAQVLATAFQPVPDTYLNGRSEVERAPAVKPFFTPLKTAEATVEPQLAPTEPGIVTLPEPITYPKYVSVGPEYFGVGSQIAPYVVSPYDAEPIRDRWVASVQRPTRRPQRPPGAYAVAEAVPRSAQSRGNLPSPAPVPNVPTEIAAALVPPRPDPQQQRVPTDQAPRAPSRRGPDRMGSPALRDEPLDLSEDTPTAWIAAESEIAAPAPRYTADLPKPATPAQNTVDFAPDETLYRVQISAPQVPTTRIASLGTPSVREAAAPLTSLSVPHTVPTGSLPEPSGMSLLTETPVPQEKPRRERAPVRIAGTLAGITTKPLLPPAQAPANDPSPASGCLVGQGSSGRMILVCDGIDVSQAQVFRAVVEGESAFRGLRDFDPTNHIIDTYGFNSDRFMAMSQGPKSARDLAFLRALRASGKSIRVRGRPFELYLMKGDLSLATVLIEQIAGAEAATAVGSR